MKKIFISYASEDAPAANEIAERLDSVGLEVWYDRREIQPGDSFVFKMNEGLEECEYLLLLVSPHSMKSDWVRREWTAALADQHIVLIPLLIAECAVPALITDILYIDMVENRQEGLDNLTKLLRRDNNPINHPHSIGPIRGNDFVTLRAESPRVIRLVARRCLDEASFHSFLFDARIEPGRIAGQSLHERLISLLLVVANEGILEEFADWLVLERERCVKHWLSEVRDDRRWSL